MLFGIANSKSPRSILMRRASFVSLDINKKCEETSKKLCTNFASVSVVEGDSKVGGNLIRGLLGILAFNSGDPRIILHCNRLEKSSRNNIAKKGGKSAPISAQNAVINIVHDILLKNI